MLCLHWHRMPAQRSLWLEHKHAPPWQHKLQRDTVHMVWMRDANSKKSRGWDFLHGAFPPRLTCNLVEERVLFVGIFKTCASLTFPHWRSCSATRTDCWITMGTAFNFLEVRLEVRRKWHFSTKPLRKHMMCLFLKIIKDVRLMKMVLWPHLDGLNHHHFGSLKNRGVKCNPPTGDMFSAAKSVCCFHGERLGTMVARGYNVKALLLCLWFQWNRVRLA